MPTSPEPSPSTGPGSSGSLTAAALAARLAGAPAPPHEATPERIRRTPATGSSGTIRRLAGASQSGVVAPTDADVDEPAGAVVRADDDEWFTAQLERNMDLITRRLEERMLVEFERRGGRMWGRL